VTALSSNSSGVYSLPAVYVATTGDLITAAQHNTPLEDIAQGLTDRLMRDGRAPMTGNLPMGGFKVTGAGEPTAATDVATKNYADTFTIAVDTRITNQTFATGLTGASALAKPTILNRLVDRIEPSWFGALGTGLSASATANTTALQAMFTAAPGKVIVLPKDAVYTFNSQLTIPAGVIIEDRGAQFNWIGTSTGTTVQMVTQGAFQANRLSVYVPSGQTCYRLLGLRGDARIGELIVGAATQQANRSSPDDAALTSNASATFLEIDKLVGSNFDNLACFTGSSGTTRVSEVRLRDVLIASYVRAIRFDECLSWIVEGGRIHTRSANSAGDNLGNSIGHNAILSEGCTYSKLSDVTALNAGEHSFRWGTSDNSLQPLDIKVSNTHSFGSGGCGLKINDNTVPSSIAISGHSSVDCGVVTGNNAAANASALAANSEGMLIEKANNVTVSGFTCSKSGQTYAAYRGLSINGVERATYTGLVIDEVKDDGIFVKADDGLIERTLIDSAIIVTTGGNGIQVQNGVKNPRDFHIGPGVHIRNYDSANTATKYGINFTTSAVSAAQPCVMSAKIENRTTSAAGLVNLQGGAKVLNNTYTM
jgi:hypothetical protein